MKALILSFFVLVGSMTIAPKKAEAGIILTASTGLAGVVLMIGGAALGVVSYANGSDQNMGGITGMFLGAALIVLDANEAIAANERFETIPSYIFDEIQAIADDREADAVLVKENLKEILLNDADVDELFSTLDESVDPTELSVLRDMLTLPLVN